MVALVASVETPKMGSGVRRRSSWWPGDGVKESTAQRSVLVLITRDPQGSFYCPAVQRNKGLLYLSESL